MNSVKQIALFGRNLIFIRKAIEDKLIKYVREENDMEMINSFIKEFPNSKFYENVIHIRNYIAYSKVANDNTLRRV